MNSEEGKAEAGQQPTKADKFTGIAAVVSSFIGLIAGLTISGYLKLAIGSSVFLVFVVLLFFTPTALKKVVRKYAWLETLIAGAAAGVVFGALVLAPAGHTIIVRIPQPPPAQTSGPPPASVVTILMTKEAAAVLAGQPTDAIRLYAPAGAFVMDAACTTHKRPRTWRGLGQILQRYLRLPAFSSLRHVDPQVTFTPGTALAKSATATAQTTGSITRSAKFPKGQILDGTEKWVFTRLNGMWWVKSFTYDGC